MGPVKISEDLNDEINTVSKGVTWEKAVDFREKEDHPVLENLVAKYDHHGDPNVLRLKEVRGKFKNKNPSKVVIKVEAATVSRMDCQIRRNIFHHHVETPHVPGCDMVGTIVQTGTKAKRYGFQVGDRVCALDLNLGSNARYVVTHSFQLIKVPPNLDPAEVVCLLRTYMTAYQCLYRAGDTTIRKGDKVLIVGGNGCVGQAVIQLAKVAGASEIYATAEGAQNKRLIESLGAMPLGKHSWQWLPVVEGEMNIVIDSVCQDGYVSSHKALHRHGKLVILGDTSSSEGGILSQFLSRNKLHLNLLKASYMLEKATIYDLFEEYNEFPDHFERDIRLLFRLLEDGTIQPRILKCIPLAEIAEAHKEIEGGSVSGAIVCFPFSTEVSVPVPKPKLKKPIRRKSAQEISKKESSLSTKEHRRQYLDKLSQLHAGSSEDESDEDVASRDDISSMISDHGSIRDIELGFTTHKRSSETKIANLKQQKGQEKQDERIKPKQQKGQDDKKERIKSKQRKGQKRPENGQKSTGTDNQMERKEGNAASMSAVPTKHPPRKLQDNMKQVEAGMKRAEAEPEVVKAGAKPNKLETDGKSTRSRSDADDDAKDAAKIEAAKAEIDGILNSGNAKANTGEAGSSYGSSFRAAEPHKKPITSCSTSPSRGILKASSYGQCKKDGNASDTWLPMSLMVHNEDRWDATAASEIQAKQIEAELLRADADAKRAEADALRAKLEARKAELALQLVLDNTGQEAAADSNNLVTTPVDSGHNEKRKTILHLQN